MKQNKNGHLPVQLEEQMPVVINPMDAPVSVFKTGLDRRKTNRDALMEWIRSSLIEGRDYGSIMICSRKNFRVLDVRLNYSQERFKSYRN